MLPILSIVTIFIQLINSISCGCMESLEEEDKVILFCVITTMQGVCERRWELYWF